MKKRLYLIVLNIVFFGTTSQHVPKNVNIAYNTERLRKYELSSTNVGDFEMTKKKSSISSQSQSSGSKKTVKSEKSTSKSKKESNSSSKSTKQSKSSNSKSTKKSSDSSKSTKKSSDKDQNYILKQSYKQKIIGPSSFLDSAQKDSYCDTLVNFVCSFLDHSKVTTTCDVDEQSLEINRRKMTAIDNPKVRTENIRKLQASSLSIFFTMKWESDDVNVVEENYDKLFLDSANSDEGLEEICSSLNASGVNCYQALSVLDLNKATNRPSQKPSFVTIDPKPDSSNPSFKPSKYSSSMPSLTPSLDPSSKPLLKPSPRPSSTPSIIPSKIPSRMPNTKSSS